jgi:hypothetical protein
MTPESAANRDRFFDLMRRFVELGKELPRVDALGDPQVRGAADVTLGRMQWLQARMDKILADERKRDPAA